MIPRASVTSLRQFSRVLIVAATCHLAIAYVASIPAVGTKPSDNSAMAHAKPGRAHSAKTLVHVRSLARGVRAMANQALLSVLLILGIAVWLLSGRRD